MTRILKKALAAVRRLDEDDEILTFRVYRGPPNNYVCIDEFTGTKSEWFDRVMHDLDQAGASEMDRSVH